MTRFTVVLRSKVGRAAALLMASACSTVAISAPVYIAHGTQVGQGYAFTLGTSCYAYTAGHVLAGGRGPVALVDQDAYRAEGKVIKVDTVLDLGLIEIVGGPQKQGRLCALGSLNSMLRIDDVLGDIRRENRDIWLDKISSPAGGLERVEMALGATPRDTNSINLALATAGPAGRAAELPKQGDSGASVWVGARAGGQARRYGRDGTATPRVSGDLLGVLTSVEGNSARIVRSDRLHEFIFDALAPVGWKTIAIEPPDIKITDQRRGGFPSRTREMDLHVSALQLAQVSFELDLGSTDVIVEGVALTFAPSAPVKGHARPPRLEVQTSQYQPGPREKWQSESCRAVEMPGAARQAGVVYGCNLRAPRITRGMRIELTGTPSLLRKISVLVKP